jgi:hypothetical protein
MGVEIDTRRIQGNGGEICWSLEDGGHVVTVSDSAGTVRARMLVTDGRAARELYEHPFAVTAVPNLFERTAEAA